MPRTRPTQIYVINGPSAGKAAPASRWDLPRKDTQIQGGGYDKAMTADAAFRSWFFSSLLIAAVVLALAFGIAILVVVLSSSRKRDD